MGTKIKLPKATGLQVMAHTNPTPYTAIAHNTMSIQTLTCTIDRFTTEI